MTGFCIFALLLLQSGGAERPKLSPELQRIVDLARATPPEFHSDALLHVAEAVWKTDAKQAIELVEESFDVAAQAQEPVPRVYALDGKISTHEALRSIALRSGLDTLSLRMAAVERMASGGQPKRALEMWRSSRPLKPRPTPCSSWLIDDVGGYLATGRKLQAPPDELEEAAIALEDVVALAGIPLDADRKAVAVSALLNSLSVDDRRFTLAAGETFQQLEPLLSHAAIRSSAANFLRRHLTATRCADNAAANAPHAKVELAVAERFGVKREARRVESVTLPDPIESNEEKILGEVITLGRMPPDSAEWRRRYSAFVQRVEDAKPAQGESDVDFFQRRTLMLGLLLSQLPVGPEMERGLSAYILLLVNSTVQHSSRIDWFLAVLLLLDSDSKVKANRERLLEMLAQSPHPVLQLCAALETTLHRKFSLQ